MIRYNLGEYRVRRHFVTIANTVLVRGELDALLTRLVTDPQIGRPTIVVQNRLRPHSVPRCATPTRTSGAN